MNLLDEFVGSPRRQISFHRFSRFAVVLLFLCIQGCGKSADESKLIGSWQFTIQKSILVLGGDHKCELRGAADKPVLIGTWHVRDNRLIIVYNSAADTSGVVRVAGFAMTNDTRIAELSDSLMVLHNWGGPSNRLVRIEVSH